MSESKAIPELKGDAAAAVAHRGGHIQIIASAGSGKTETVSQRIAKLVAEGVEPARIVAFTFTERAAEELKARIRARVEHFAGAVAADRLGTMYVGTIHGYCFQLLTTYVTKYESYGVLDEKQQTVFMQRHSFELAVKNLDAKGQLFSGISGLRSALDVIENEMLDIELLPEELRVSVEKFYALLDTHRLLTFGRQITAAVEALMDPAIHSAVTSELEHLIVDEYQDVNPAQEELIRLLARPVGSADLVVVGDDDQAIYQWRGSTVENITTFTSRYSSVNTFSLLQNRRSRPDIVGVANGFAKSIPGRLDKEMRASKDPNGPAVDIVLDFVDEATEARELAMTVQRLHRSGYRYSDMAVLVRGKVAYPAILSAFEEMKIPVQPGGRVGLFSQADANFLGRCFVWLVDFKWKKGQYDQSQENVTLASLRDLAKLVYGIDANQWKQVERALNALRSKVGTDSRRVSLVNETYALLDHLGAKDWDASDPVLASRLGSIARFISFVADYEAVQMRARAEGDGQVGASDQKDWYFKNFASLMINFAISDYMDFEGEEDLLSDSVEVMTIHAAKGLEWPIVFLPSLTKGRFPSSRSGTANDRLVPNDLYDHRRYDGGDADERRLFYVAMTRAAEWISLSAHQKVTKNKVTPSPYLLEVDKAFDGNRQLPSDGTGTNAQESPDLFITYSDLALYLSCGYSYWLRNKIGFPAALVEEIGYGNAVHHLMRVIAEETQRTGKTLGPKDIDRILATDFFLPFANKTLADRFKSRARDLVNRYMDDHADDMKRVWETERPFELALPGVIISGRADVILDKGETGVERLAIVDYKTEIDERDLGLQLQVYTIAGQREGLNVEGAFLHDLGKAERVTVDTSPAALDAALQVVVDAAEGIKARKFDVSPERSKCARCDVRAMCRSRKD
jgi:DNA helicase-2/ATP-dependent DNA helicase PcrA